MSNRTLLSNRCSRLGMLLAEYELAPGESFSDIILRLAEQGDAA
jgi:hypothetical protein